jgi:hypothetical protein
MLKAIKADLNYDIPHDNKNSGQALAQILAEKSNPVGDIGYFGVTFGMKAKAQDALEPYKPVNWDQVPAGLKDADGYWTTIHSGTLGLFVNKDALGGKPVPACWKDLLKPDYKGMVGYLDPSSAAVGYVGAVAVNLALGGSSTSFDPAINFFKELRKTDPIVPKQTSYARVVSGEMPILFDYEQLVGEERRSGDVHVSMGPSVRAPAVRPDCKTSPSPCGYWSCRDHPTICLAILKRPTGSRLARCVAQMPCSTSALMPRGHPGLRAPPGLAGTRTHPRCPDCNRW